MSNTKDNWRELAELLGLPTDEPAPPAPAAPSPPPPPAFPPASSTLPPAVHVAPEPAFHEEFPPLVAEECVAEELATTDDLVVDEAEPPRSPEGEESPSEERRGRRRGRRGRRRGRDEGPEEAAVGAEAPTEGTVDAEPRERPRSRRPEPAQTAVAEDDNEHDDFSQDAWADWNVPNWQELIDGLHRPDRDR